MHVSGEIVRVRLTGSSWRVLLYQGIEAADREHQSRLIAADLKCIFGLLLAYAGVLDIAGDLVASGLAETSVLDDVAVTSDIVLTLLRSRHASELESLVKRLLLETHSDTADSVFATLLRNQDRLDVDTRRKVAQAMVAASESDDTLAIRCYNAGSLLKRVDFALSRDFYERAALANPDYRRRGYWWSDQAATYFHEGDLPTAEKYYRAALELGEGSVLPLLADVVLRQGRYAEAIAMFSTVNQEVEYSDAQWRLTEVAFGYLHKFFGVDNQDRDAQAADRLFEEMREAETSDASAPSKDALLRVLDADLMHPFALWAAVHLEREEGRPVLPFVLGAAVSLLYMPALWEESLRAANAHYPELVPDILLCIKQFCREDFLSLIHWDSFVDEQSRAAFIELLDVGAEPPAEPFIIRDRDGKPLDPETGDEPAQCSR